MHPALRDIQAQVSIDLLFCGPQTDVQGFSTEFFSSIEGFFACWKKSVFSNMLKTLAVETGNEASSACSQSKE